MTLVSGLRAITAGGGLLLLIGAVACSGGGSDWELVWADEFEGPAGQSPHPDKWGYDVGTDWGNACLEFDTDRPENVSLDGEGNLKITARAEVYEGQPYTSGRINTNGFFDQAFGRFEARIRLPLGQGMWPAFWLLAANFAEAGWPECGEIDIMEYRGQEPSLVHGSLHGPGYSAGSAVTGSHTIKTGFHENFHVFGVEWGAERITWTLDGKPYQTVTSGDLPEGGKWVYDHPFFIILNLAVGGHFVGPPHPTTAFPQSMLVDWVRVYRRTP